MSLMCGPRRCIIPSLTGSRITVSPPTGRIGPLSYFLRNISAHALVILAMVVMLFPYMGQLDTIDPTDVNAIEVSTVQWVIVCALFFFAVGLWTSSTVKRLHDLGLSGVWTLAVVAVTTFGGVGSRHRPRWRCRCSRGRTQKSI